MSISEINQDTFWTLIDQARSQCGEDLDSAAKWLEQELIKLGPEQALNFHNIMHGYRDLAHQYGLWSAASILCEYGCSDDGFTDFRAWLVYQGREVYMAALKDPDSLADVPRSGGGYFETLSYVGTYAYRKLTGKDAYDQTSPAAEQKLAEELKRGIVYGEGINYPYLWSETADYLPHLCAKYLTPGSLAILVQHHNDTWNLTSPDVKQARETASKGSKSKHRGGDAR